MRWNAQLERESKMPTNLTATEYERTRYAPTDLSEPPQWWEHTPPNLPGTPPVYEGWGAGTGTLNSFERAEVDRYIANPTDAVLASLTLPDAIAKANEFKTYFATADYKAWRAANWGARRAQSKFFHADALINNKATTPVSSDGTGSTPPPDTQPPGTNVP